MFNGRKPRHMQTRSYGYLIFLILCLTFFFSWLAPLDAQTGRKTVVLEVSEILQLPPEGDTGTARIMFTFKSGPEKGDTVLHRSHLWGHADYDKNFRVGKQFMATAEYENGSRQRLILGQQRRELRIIVLFLFVSLLLFAVGRWEGLAGLVATVITVLLLFYFLFPFVFIGRLILPAGIFICLTTIIITILLVMRKSRATLPVMLSLGTVFLIIFLMTIAGLQYLHLDASLARHSRLILMRIQTEAGIGIDELWKLITVGIVLSTLGAVMDVAVVIGSTIDEISRDRPDISLRRSFKSGMKVGAEILSTMINTLIFAYLGLMFPLLLCLHVFGIPWLRFVNYDFVGIEILRAFIGLVGLSLTIPLTSIFTAWWCNRQ